MTRGEEKQANKTFKLAFILLPFTAHKHAHLHEHMCVEVCLYRAFQHDAPPGH